MKSKRYFFLRLCGMVNFAMANANKDFSNEANPSFNKSSNLAYEETEQVSCKRQLETYTKKRFVFGNLEACKSDYSCDKIRQAA